MISLAALNALPVSDFVATLGAIFEHSPWVAERAAAARPFTSRLHLLDAMRAVVQRAHADEQLGLIRAHPQLGARGRNRAQLTEASSREQRRAGLDACTDDEFAQLMRLNAAYVGKFSFPFILAVRGHGPESILASLGSRLENDAELERHTALTQIGLIGGYRLADAVSSPAGAEIAAMRERLVAAGSQGAAVGDRRPANVVREASESGIDAVTTGRTTSAGNQIAALLREWMLAAGLEVYDSGASAAAGVSAAGGASAAGGLSASGSAAWGSDGMIGAQQGDQPGGRQREQGAGESPRGRERLLVGAYRDRTTGALRRDGTLGSLIGIEVAQQVRQRHLASRFDLLVFAAPGDEGEQRGSVLTAAESHSSLNCAALTAADIESLAPLRSAAVSERGMAIVSEGPARMTGQVAQSPDVRTLERAAQRLEAILTAQI